MEACLSGLGFGAALTAAGLAQSSVVALQMRLQDWHLLQSFCSATVFTGVIYALANRLGYVKLQPRSSSPLGLFATYDGNILGGALLGVGMAISASGPELALAQAAAGVPHGFYAAAGGVLGGILWSGFLAGLAKRCKQAAQVKPEVVTINQSLGLSYRITLLILGFVWSSGMVLLQTSSLAENWWPVLGGLFISASQLLSILRRRSMVGISGAYEEVGNHFWSSLRGQTSSITLSSSQNCIFGLGTVCGAWLTAALEPSLVTGKPFTTSPLTAVLGGVLMIVGSRLAGGCTSGHGLSGLALLSTSSLVTMATAFSTPILLGGLTSANF
ncbi:hypothetical protein S40288_02489 [Stachybotrys chartarum IBT 40288]|nr:hypothetical protein S40288_02489 [Stachybotrys chartarum IBT 40288]